MEENRIELDCLKEALYYMEKVSECFLRCNHVSEEEYGKFEEFREELNNRKVDLEIEVKNTKIMEV